jgi:hypothetical protein
MINAFDRDDKDNQLGCSRPARHSGRQAAIPVIEEDAMSALCCDSHEATARAVWACGAGGAPGAAPPAAGAAACRWGPISTAAGAWTPTPPSARPEEDAMDHQGRTFRALLRDQPYLFTGGVYSPLDAHIAEPSGWA